MERLTWEEPPVYDDPTTLTRAEIGKTLDSRPGRWAIVARADRAARAAAMVERINSGREYGSGYDAIARQVGPEHRVYARKGN
jgi:hypothetical protein